MLDFLDIADLLGWHDVEVMESVETSEFPTIYPVMDIAMDSDWPYADMTRPITRESQLKEYLDSRLEPLRLNFSWREAFTTLSNLGVYTWKLRRYLQNTDAINFDTVTEIMRAHVDNFLKHENQFVRQPGGFTLPKYCNEYVINDLFRGAIGIPFGWSVVSAAVVNSPNVEVDDSLGRAHYIFTKKPSFQIDCQKLLQAIEASGTDLFPPEEANVISAHDFTGIPYRRAWAMQQHGELNQGNLIEEFASRLAELHSLHEH